jgi:hypothetical protein
MQPSSSSSATPSMAMVPTGSGTIVKYTSESALAEARSMIEAAIKEAKILGADSRVRTGGTSFMIIVEAINQNDKPGPDGRIGYTVKGPVGSLKRTTGQGTYSDPEGDYMILPLGISKKGKVQSYPRSRVTGNPIQYTAVSRGRFLMVFTMRDPQDITHRVTAYLTMVTANLTAPKLTGKEGETQRKIMSLLEAADNAPDTTTTAAAVAVASTSAVATPIVLSDRAIVMKKAEPSKQVSAQSTGVSSPPTWYKPTRWAKRSNPPLDAVAAYLDPTSTVMTSRERECFEIEFPELGIIPPGAIPAGTSLDVTWRCESLTPTFVQEYANQARDDILYMLKTSPGMEQGIWEMARMRLEADAYERNAMNDIHAKDTFFVNMRNKEDSIRVGAGRIEDVSGRVSVMGIVPESDSTPKTYISFSPNDNCYGTCFTFSSSFRAWMPGMSYAVEKANNRIYTVKVVGCAYHELVYSALGITSTPFPGTVGDGAKQLATKHAQWTAMAKRLAADPSFISFIGRIDWKNTASMSDNYHRGPDNKVFSYTLGVDNFLVDMAAFLPKNAIPVTQAGASSVLNKPLPSVKDMKTANSARIPAFICLSETANMDRFADAIAAGCQFYVFCDFSVSKSDLDTITPEMGDAIFGDNWNSEADIVVPVRTVKREKDVVVSDTVETKTLSCSSNIRTNLKTIATSSFVTVWAVRPTTSTSAARANAMFQLYNNGGYYTEAGFPIISDVSDAKPESKRPAPDFIDPTEETQPRKVPAPSSIATIIIPPPPAPAPAPPPPPIHAATVVITAPPPRKHGSRRSPKPD